MRRCAFTLLMLGTASAAHAGDKVLIQPVPAWVKPAPPIDTAKLTDDSPVVVVLDNQQKLEAGQVWNYTEAATRAANQQLLGAIGTIQLPWQPAQGDLILHKAEIVRGTQRIDLLKGSAAKFTVLRREQGLDQRALDGMLTATMPVEGLSTGDVLHLVWSVTRRDPTLQGNLQTFAPLVSAPVKFQFGRVRLLWPSAADVHWKSYSDGVAAAPVTADGYKELTVSLPLPKQPDVPKDAPMRYQKLPVLEATSFADWAAVSKVMAPLYATDGLIAPGSPLAAEVARIEGTSPDPMTRTALALQLVQEKVRYLLLGMDTGNYVPQPPAQTWDVRYGDCKAKTLLLLALLHAMKIEAEPALASIGMGDMVADHLPGAGAFNHVFVRAVVNGETLWLDGTGTGARLADLHDTPPYRTVLPVRAAGAAPMPLPIRPDARPGIAVTLDLDERAGAGFPAPYKAVVVLRGALADATKLASQAGKDEVDEFVAKLMGNYVNGPAVVTRSFATDEATATATLTTTGIAYPDWSSENRRLKSALDKAVTAIDFGPDRARTAWQAIPVKTDDPSTVHVVTRITLPANGAGFTLDGDAALSATLAGQAVTRKATLAAGIVTLDDRVTATGQEIAAADIPTERRGIALAKSRLPRLIAPADDPPEWRHVELARQAKLFDPLLALYAKRIADAPDRRERYTDRAWFLERIYDRRAAIADYDKAIALEPNVDSYLARASLYQALGDDKHAIADAEAALKIDPSSASAVSRLATLKVESGDKDGALALVQDRIDQGGKDAPTFLSSKADLLAEAGDAENALTAIDQAIAAKPGDPSLLNARCWIKGTRNTALDTALKDCTKAIELADSTANALDSRAMVYFRMNRMEDALADLNAVLDDNPGQAESLFMRGVVQHRLGKAAAGDLDLAGARVIEPQIDRTYARYGIKP